MTRNGILDLLALIKTGSVTLAAQTRNTSQSAYSRRLQALETHLKVSLVDRENRPSGPTYVLRNMRFQLEAALVALDNLVGSFATETSPPLRIAALHSIAANILPGALRDLEQLVSAHDIRIRSANLEQCFQMLMTEEVAAMLFYEAKEKRVNPPKEVVERSLLGGDEFIPVCSPNFVGKLKASKQPGAPIPVITYPPSIFLGEIIHSFLLPKLEHTPALKVTSGLTQAVQACIESDLGYGWLPRSAVQKQLDTRRLVDIQDFGIPTASLDVVMLHLTTGTVVGVQPALDELKKQIAKMLGADNRVQAPSKEATDKFEAAH